MGGGMVVGKIIPEEKYVTLFFYFSFTYTHKELAHLACMLRLIHTHVCEEERMKRMKERHAASDAASFVAAAAASFPSSPSRSSTFTFPPLLPSCCLK
jgi:hypothetical protein